MNYNQSGARRGRPRRVVDPSVGSSPQPPAAAAPPPPPEMQQNPYMYNQQQVPTNNGMPDYGFHVSEPSAPAYGFNPATMSSPQQPPIQPYSTINPQMTSYPGSQFTSQILAEPIVANMAMKYGDALVDQGKQQIEKYVRFTALKYYFAVDTDYVFVKLALLFFPFTQKDWSVKYEQDVPLQPRYEKNAPDLYIPTMAFLTYVVMAGLALGTQERFTHEQLGIIASSALAWGVFEILVHFITLYVTNLDTSLRIFDLLAYCGYKYVGINAAVGVSLIFSRFGYYSVLIYFSISLAFFLIRSLKLRVIPEGHTSYTASGNKRRLYFILFVAGIQPLLMWWLSYHLIA